MAGINITEKRKEELELMQTQLRELDNSIQEILDGKSSMKQFAEKYGITSQELNTSVNKGIATLLRRVKVADENDVFELLKDSMTPGEKLIHAMFTMNPKNNNITILDVAEEEKVIEVIEKSLTARECTVIKYRFGFNDVVLTLEEVGKILNVSRDRVRQIEMKALRKLRHPSRLKMLLPNYELRIQALMDHKKLIEVDNTLSEVEKVENNTNREVPQAVLNLPIDELELSVRTYNCLKRSGCDLIGELAGYSLEDLMHIRNLGRKSIQEILDKLNNLGIKINSESVNIGNPSTSSLNLSRAAKQRLSYMNINNISKLSKYSTSDLLRRMHCKYVKEIAQELEKVYGVKLADNLGILHDYTDDQVIAFLDNTPPRFKYDYDNKSPIEVLRLPIYINMKLFRAGIDTIDKLVKAGPKISQVTDLLPHDIDIINSAVFSRYGGRFDLD